MAIKTFTTGEVLTASDTNTYLANSGLVYVTSATVGTGVSSVTVSNCFSSTYDAYKIVWVGGVGSANNAVGIQLAPSSVSGYDSLYYGALGWTNWAGTQSTATNNNSTRWTFVGSCNTTQAVLSTDIYQPFLTKWTTFGGQYMDTGLTGATGGSHQVAASFTGFTIIPNAGTISGGTITVYGYRKA